MMKRLEFFKVDLETRFSESKLEHAQMYFLRGGDGDGGQGSDGPWDPPD